MLNQKQLHILSAATAQALSAGSGVLIEGRKLAPGEFAPIASRGQSGGLIFTKTALPAEVGDAIGLCAIPCVDHEGRERLGIFIHASKGVGRGMTCLALLDPSVAGALVRDLMGSAAQFADPTTAADVAKAVTDAALEMDLAIKETLAENSRAVIRAALEARESDQAKLQKSVYAAAIGHIEQEADKRAAKRFAKDALALAEIAAEPRASVRSEALEGMTAKLEEMANLATK
jgi:hypothetical protein